jgi:5-methyltetrahydrofolate--homocysteine methyltransferase
MTFTIVGERINTTLKNVQDAVADRDAAYIEADVKEQEAAGATFIDVNAGARIGHEKEDMQWLLKIIQDAVTVPLCLDSPDPAVLEMAYGMVEKTPMVNSISLEKQRYDAMIPFLKGKACKIIALCMDDTGMPTSADDVVTRAKKIVQALEDIGIKRDDIYVDPLIQPMSVDIQNGMMAMEAVKRIMTENSGVHTIGGLSNISYGLPQRRIINRNFLTLMMAAGLDAAIMDPLDHELVALLKTTEMLLGQDEYCMNFITAVREGRI